MDLPPHYQRTASRSARKAQTRSGAVCTLLALSAVCERKSHRARPQSGRVSVLRTDTGIYRARHRRARCGLQSKPQGPCVYAKLRLGWVPASRMRQAAVTKCANCQRTAQRSALLRPKGANKISNAVCTLHAPDAACAASRNAPACGGSDKRL